MGGNRFWEFYLVRYLLGTIFGIVILFFLVSNYNAEITAQYYPKSQSENGNVKDEINSLLFSTTYGVKTKDANVILEALGINHFFVDKEEIKDVEGKIINIEKEYIEIKQTGFPILAAIILAVAGFLYMYFSSMLILILHGVRSILFFYPPTNKGMCIIHIFYMSFLFVLFLLLIPWMIMGDFGEVGKHAISSVIVLGFWGLSLLSSIHIKQFYMDLSLFRTGDKERKGKKYKRFKLIAAKQGIFVNKVNASDGEIHTEQKDYIESYKHLREHGNAFGIIVCELIFASWLIFWQFSYWAVFYWCMIGFSSWTLGSYLEVNRVKLQKGTTLK